MSVDLDFDDYEYVVPLQQHTHQHLQFHSEDFNRGVCSSVIHIGLCNIVFLKKVVIDSIFSMSTK